MITGPSESVVAAVDAPFPFVRANLGAYLRAVGPLLLVSQLAMVPGQIMQGGMGGVPTAEMVTRFAASMGMTMLGLCFYSLVYPLVTLAAYAVTADLVAGREPTFAGTLRAVLNPVRYVTAVVIGVLVGIGNTFMVGGVLVTALLGFTYPILFEEGVGGVESARRSVLIARYGAGDRFWESPGARLAMAGVASWGLIMALGSLAAIPIWGDMGWRAWQAMTRGQDPMAALRGVSPVVTIVSALIGAASRIVTDSYLCIASTLIYRDVRRRMRGDDLEARIAALEPR